MSEYEGKVPKKRRTLDLIDILYYEATGEILPLETRIKMENSKKEKEN